MAKKPPASDLISRELPRPVDYESTFPRHSQTASELKNQRKEVEKALVTTRKEKADAYDRYDRAHDLLYSPRSPLNAKSGLASSLTNFVPDIAEGYKVRFAMAAMQPEKRETKAARAKETLARDALHQAELFAKVRDRKREEHDARWGEGAYDRELDRLRKSYERAKAEPASPRRKELMQEKVYDLMRAGVAPVELVQTGMPYEELQELMGDDVLKTPHEFVFALDENKIEALNALPYTVSRARIRNAQADKNAAIRDNYLQAKATFAQGSPELAAAELDHDTGRREILQAQLPNAMRSQRPYLEQAIDLLDKRIRENEDFLAAQESPVE